MEYFLWYDVESWIGESLDVFGFYMWVFSVLTSSNG